MKNLKRFTIISEEPSIVRIPYIKNLKVILDPESSVESKNLILNRQNSIFNNALSQDPSIYMVYLLSPHSSNSTLILDLGILKQIKSIDGNIYWTNLAPYNHPITYKKADIQNSNNETFYQFKVKGKVIFSTEEKNFFKDSIQKSHKVSNYINEEYTINEEKPTEILLPCQLLELTLYKNSWITFATETYPSYTPFIKNETDEIQKFLYCSCGGAIEVYTLPQEVLCVKTSSYIGYYANELKASLAILQGKIQIKPFS